MVDIVNQEPICKRRKKPLVARLAFTVLLAGLAVTVHAGKITSIPSPVAPDAGTFSGVQDRFGGWNLDNVFVNFNGSFDEATGAYAFTDDTDLSYRSDVDESGTVLGYVLAKDWPVGEPTGIKIVNDDFDAKRAANCIMSTSYLEDHLLDSADPRQVLCSGPFQSHKRYKLAMLPATVAGGAGAEKGIDLVFNVEQDGTSRDYQVFQKINNWTDVRLQGFTVEVGTGIGAGFVPASALTGVGLVNLSLSIPTTVWERTNQLANFSQGLFGPVDTKHFRPAGFFDPLKRAGFNILEYGIGNPGEASGQTDILTSGDPLASDYADVPAGAGAAANQFGPWLPNNMLPYGIFFDDDNNPDTDNQLVAWYGYSPAVGGLRWMYGAADNFALVADETITGVWGNDPLYSMGEIDDLVNVGLNYLVTVGDISSFPGFDADPALNNATFTIRITPKVETIATPDPLYVGVTPNPLLDGSYTSQDAIISLAPAPDFVIGDLLTVTVSDVDLNTNPAAIDTALVVDVSTSDGSVAPVTGLEITENAIDSGVFTAVLPAQFSNVAAGVTVTVTYTDADDGTGSAVVKTDDSTAIAVPLSYGTIQFDPVAYKASEKDGSVELTITRTDGTDGVVEVSYQTISGTAIANEDYIPDSDNIQFMDGEATRTITIFLIDDLVDEPDKSFTVLLSNTRDGATLGAEDTATITLTDRNGSSSGCSLSYNPDGKIDPLLPGIVLISLIYLGWRSRRNNAR